MAKLFKRGNTLLKLPSDNSKLMSGDDCCCGDVESCGFASGLNTADVYDSSTGWMFNTGACSSLGATASGSGTAIHGTAGDQPDMVVRLGICSGTFTLAKVYLAYTSPSDNLSVEAAVSGSDYILRLRRNGTLIVSKTVTVAYALRYIQGCYYNGVLTIEIEGPDDGFGNPEYLERFQTGIDPADVTGLKAGFQVTSGVGVDVDYFNAQYTKTALHPNCPECPTLYESGACATYCDTDTAPSTVTVEFSGATDGGCDYYSNLNHTAILSWDDTPAVSGNCEWVLSYTWLPSTQRRVCSAADCSNAFDFGINSVRLSIGKTLLGVSPPAGKMYVSVQIALAGFLISGSIVFQKLVDIPMSGTFDCTTIFDYMDVPYLSDDFSACTPNDPNASGMVCTLNP